jgi:amidase
MIGPDWRDPWWVPVPFEGAAVEKPVRVALTTNPGGVGVDDDVASGVREAAKALEAAGYAVEEVDPPQVREALDLWSSLVMTEIAAGFSELLGQIGSADANKFLGLALEARPPLDSMGYVLGLANRNGIARAWSEFQARYPIILGPVNTRAPFKVGKDLESAEAVEEIIQSMALVVPLNLLGLPAVVSPVGVANGLPQAVQVTGGRYREDLCLDAAEAIERRLGTLVPIDPSQG